jgi:hypothetical protein
LVRLLSIGLACHQGFLSVRYYENGEVIKF